VDIVIGLRNWPTSTSTSTCLHAHARGAEPLCSLSLQHELWSDASPCTNNEQGFSTPPFSMLCSASRRQTCWVTPWLPESLERLHTAQHFNDMELVFPLTFATLSSCRRTQTRCGRVATCSHSTQHIIFGAACHPFVFPSFLYQYPVQSVHQPGAPEENI
jgi:hypothetical protein